MSFSAPRTVPIRTGLKQNRMTVGRNSRPTTACLRRVHRLLEEELRRCDKIERDLQKFPLTRELRSGWGDETSTFSGRERPDRPSGPSRRWNKTSSNLGPSSCCARRQLALPPMSAWRSTASSAHIARPANARRACSMTGTSEGPTGTRTHPGLIAQIRVKLMLHLGIRDGDASGPIWNSTAGPC